MSSSLASNSTTQTDKLRLLLANTQLSRSKLDEITAESKRINNNLKLYFIINVLTETTAASQTNNKSGDENDDVEERLLRSFRVKYVVSSSNGGSSSKSSLENCLCMLTNKSVFVFKIVNQEMFEQNVEFDKCLTKCHVIPISQIEIIELSVVQNFLMLEVVELSRNTTTAGRCFYKLATFDIYQTQTILNSLSSNLPTFQVLRKINVFISKFVFFFFGF